MSAPKLIIQIAITGAQIFGKAFFAAGKQAVQNAKSRPQAIAGGDAAGVQNATSGSITDKLTREHRMTIDEARLILNLKKEDPSEVLRQRYEHLFKANSPPPKDAQPPRRGVQLAHSHYLQSKVFRALERLEAEAKAATGEQPAAPAPPTPPPATESSQPKS